jgi:DNA-binding NarL/FixJ family response regulator
MIVQAADAAMNGLRDCVLVVDDEILIAELWCMILEDMEIEVCGVAKTAASAIALANRFRPKVVLMDVRLEGQADGVDAAISILETVGSKVIFITGSRDSLTIARIQAVRPARVLFKPLGTGQLQDAVAAVLQD